MNKMNFLMNGRVDKNEFHGGNNYTYLTTPAVDAYSQPSAFKVRSPSQLGAVGTELELVCTVSGYIHVKTWKDKASGDTKTFDEAKVFFDAVLAGQAEVKKAG